jgi:hypothetical protein
MEKTAMPRTTKLSWTPEQVARLEDLVASGASAVRAAAALRRSIISVQTRARELGMPFPPRRALKKNRIAKEAEAALRP